MTRYAGVRMHKTNFTLHHFTRVIISFLTTACVLQLAYLNVSGAVAAIISEDTDMIAFGAHVVLFKMDKARFLPF